MKSPTKSLADRPLAVLVEQRRQIMQAERAEFAVLSPEVAAFRLACISDAFLTAHPHHLCVAYQTKSAAAVAGLAANARAFAAAQPPP